MAHYELHVKLIEANDLAAADSNGKSDPYCIIKSSLSQVKSKVIEKTLNPHWDQLFTLQIVPKNEKIHLAVYDHDYLSKDDPLGNAVIELNELNLQPNTPCHHSVKLQNADSGEVHLEFTLVEKKSYIN